MGTTGVSVVVVVGGVVVVVVTTTMVVVAGGKVVLVAVVVGRESKLVPAPLHAARARERTITEVTREV
jgi:hypothetical protein